MVVGDIDSGVEVTTVEDEASLVTSEDDVCEKDGSEVDVLL